MSHATVTDSLAERLQELGGIAADRVRSSPAPGTATLDDLVHANDHSKPLCELTDNALVEKRWDSRLRLWPPRSFEFWVTLWLAANLGSCPCADEG